MWTVKVLKRDRPLYVALADQLAADIESGRLAPGTRLPPQRALAAELGVDFTTISRGYAEARRRGLIVGQVGRGTFVRPDRTRDRQRNGGDSAQLVDLSLNLPPTHASEAAARALADTLAELQSDVAHLGLLDYQPNAGMSAHRAAGATWAAQHAGVEATPEEIVICSGAQHALTSLLMELTNPGDSVATESLTYPGFRALAARLRLTVEGLPIDEEGLRVEPFRAACRAGRIKVLYCTPTLHNPTAATMSGARRRAIARIARDADVAIIEDDVYGPLAARHPPSLTSFSRDRSYYIASLSKVVAPGLRIAYVLTPDARHAERLASAVRATSWMAAPLMGEIAARWIMDGTATQLLRLTRREIITRQQLARTILPHTVQVVPESLHIWLELPGAWSSAEFALLARRSGVSVAPADAFAVGKAPAAVRLSVGSPRSIEDLERALRVLAYLLESGPGAVARI
jgi:DNA-binding transcriptional MocR family regulator